MQIMTKKQYNFNAVLMLLIGSVALAAGTYLLMAPKQSVNETAIHHEKTTSCISAAAAANMAATEKDKNTITIAKSDISDFKFVLASASYIISECEGFKMKKMCMGVSCTTPGFSMEVEYSPPKQNEVQKALQTITSTGSKQAKK